MAKRTHSDVKKPQGEQHLSQLLWQQVLDAIKKLDDSATAQTKVSEGHSKRFGII
jgi:hypothetical protein